MFKQLFQRVSAAPTLPKTQAAARKFDVADFYRGPVPEADSAQTESTMALDEKLRQAYFWIVNTAILSPHYDVEYQNEPSPQFLVGDKKSRLTLPSAQSYSSYVLLPLLSFATQRKCLFVGGPGRGKTASAILMGVLAGYPVHEVKRAMQHGHPQMTIADLLGNPLPADLMRAESTRDIRISWRRWLSMRVKIIDEYNRIPTRTQSALLTLMGDGYAELMDQIFESPASAWFLTANDDQGGGTYQVIDALRDRIDVIVQALPFNPRFLDQLLMRIEENLQPEQAVPAQIVFTEAELDQMQTQVREVAVPVPVRRRLEFFSSQFELAEAAGEQFEYKGKDTARLAGTDWAWLVAQDTGRDRMKDLGCQTKNGLSVRNLMTLLMYAKAMAFFRGQTKVSLEDLRQVLPFVLNDKLKPDLDAPFFAVTKNAVFKSDRIGWLRQLFDASCAEYDRLDLDRTDPVGQLAAQFSQGLEGLIEKDAVRRLTDIERLITQLTQGRKLYGPLHDDLMLLKYLHQRYRNYLLWVRQQ